MVATALHPDPRPATQAAPYSLPATGPALPPSRSPGWWGAGGSQLCSLSSSLSLRPSACPTSHSIPFRFYGLIFRLKR